MASSFEMKSVRAAMALVSALSLAGCCGGSSKQSGCGSDADCKGNRVCVDGACVTPERAPAQNAPPPPAPAPAPAPVAQCYNGAARACDCPGLGKGNQTCQNGFWGRCKCSSRVKRPTGSCVNGQTRACPCGDGTNGQATCMGGRWSSCAMCD
jgi:hypothetical protein